MKIIIFFFFFFSSRRRHTRFKCDWSSDVCSSDLTIPHIVTIPGMITGLILGSFVLPLGVGRSVTGFLVGGGVLMAATIVEALRKKEIGGGDWKYAAMIGSFIGPQSIGVALVFTGILGIVGGIVLAVAGVHGRPQALGPWLSAGAVASILFTRLS